MKITHAHILLFNLAECRYHAGIGEDDWISGGIERIEEGAEY